MSTKNRGGRPALSVDELRRRGTYRPGRHAQRAAEEAADVKRRRLDIQLYGQHAAENLWVIDELYSESARIYDGALEPVTIRDLSEVYPDRAVRLASLDCVTPENLRLVARGQQLPPGCEETDRLICGFLFGPEREPGEPASGT